ncbi:MAG: HEAT repeat domain-containing protein, partial [Planctomycetota bacterium]|nr:HEAT repeat domain-containing protein [Planctomycetota bacterium]
PAFAFVIACISRHFHHFRCAAHRVTTSTAVLFLIYVPFLGDTTRTLAADVSGRDIGEVANELRQGNPEQRRDAAYELASRGAKSLPALHALREALADPDEQVVAQSLLAITRIGDQAAEAVPDLVLLLADDDQQRRFRASHLLGRIGVSAIPALQTALQSQHANIRQGAAEAFANMPSLDENSLAILLPALADDDPSVRSAIAIAVGRIGQATEPSLLHLLQSANETHLQGAIAALSEFSPQLPATVAALVRFSEHPVSQTRAHAMRALSRSGLPLTELQPILVRALSDPDSVVRDAGIASVYQLGPRAVNSLPLFAEMLQSSDPIQRNAAACAMHVIGPMAPEIAVPALVRAMSVLNSVDTHEVDPHEYEKNLINAIGRVGKPAASVVCEAARKNEITLDQLSACLTTLGVSALPAIEMALGDTNTTVRTASIITLGNMDGLPEATIKRLGDSLHDESLDVQVAAIRSLAAQGEQARSQQAVLQEILTNANPLLRREALFALLTVAETPASLLPQLKRALNDADDSIRRRSLESLAGISFDNTERSNLFLSATRDSVASVRMTAVYGLASCTPPTEAMQGRLLVLLRDGDPTVRGASAAAIGTLDLEQPLVVQALTESLKDADPQVVTAALTSLGQIGAMAKGSANQVADLQGHSFTSVRSAVATTLSRMNAQPETQIRSLVLLLKDREWEVRNAATVALGKLGPAARDAVPELFSLLSSDVDASAVRATLHEIDDPDPRTIPMLLDGLKSDNHRSRFMAVVLLGRVGPQARVALPALKLLAGEGKEPFQKAVSRAIEQIEGGR